jgi:hypothetical protein
MEKHPQNRFRRLVIVTDNKRGRQSAGPRWWRPKPPDQAIQTKQAARAQFKALRMAVMPTLSRGIWLEVMVWIANFIRGYFVSRPKQQRRAVVLSFRRRGFRGPWAEEGRVSKKASGSVCWSSDRETVPQEGGRG